MTRMMTVLTLTLSLIGATSTTRVVAVDGQCVDVTVHTGQPPEPTIEICPFDRE